MYSAVSLRVGQYLNCVIDDVKNNGRVVHLSITQSDVAAAIATEEQQWTLNNLLPGLVVKAEIQEVLFPGNYILSKVFVNAWSHRDAIIILFLPVGPL